MKRYGQILLTTGLILILNVLMNVFLLESLVMSANDEYTLTVNIIGSGTIDIDPSGGVYSTGTKVTLTAIAAPNYEFVGWSGDLNGKPNPKTITIDGDKTITATFTQDEYTLTVNITGNGSVTLDPDQTTYHYGDIVQLTANSNPGWTFTNWSGDLSSSDNPETIIVDGNKIVTANYNIAEYTLTVGILGDGSVTKNPDKATYNYGDAVQLTAVPDSGCDFISWSGSLSGSTNPDIITMDGIKMVTATFTDSTTGGSSTGGSGGGGGGGMVGVLAFGYIIDAQGRISLEARAISENGEAYLLLSPGTYCLLNGSPLVFITIIPLSENEIQPPTPDYMEVLSRYFKLGPEGSTFDPPIKLIFNYDSEMIPEGINPIDMIIMRWSDQLQQWIPLESRVDPEKKIIWAEIPDFSLYTVMVSNRPADISVEKLTITPNKIIEGESITIEALLVNSGDFTGSYEAILKIDSDVKETRLIEIAKKDRVTISFNLATLKEGTHQVTIGEVVDTVTVVKQIVEPIPAKFNISSLEITPDEINIGEEVNVSVRVDNTGETAGIYRVVCKINGDIFNEKEITIANGMGETVVFTLSIEEPGIKTINVNELTGSLVVKEEKEESGKIAEGKTLLIPEKPTPTLGYRWIVVLIVVICALLITLAIYLIKMKKI